MSPPASHDRPPLSTRLTFDPPIDDGDIPLVQGNLTTLKKLQADPAPKDNTAGTA